MSYNTSSGSSANVRWTNVTWTASAATNLPRRPQRPPDDGTAGALAVLGIPPGLPPDAIRRAFRAKLKQTHPDHGGSDEAVRRVIDAYRKLCPDDADIAA